MRRILLALIAVFALVLTTGPVALAFPADPGYCDDHPC